MNNKDKYDLRDISYNLELNNGGYDFVVYYTSKEIYREFFGGDISICSAFTKWLEEEYKLPILDDVEKAYLSVVIKPFRDRVISIEKRLFSGEREYLSFRMHDWETIALPFFTKGTMYKGMEVYRKYTLEELGL